ncbi:hypothetical protein [Nocardioides kribbensis]|uniref:hypothetical protein n=1 Tax=Nocardioides kribbensis TaxID=305517 RepID=UPI0018798288|nr:hypothetical protein [Nocardioides kribbensis]
MKPDDSLPPPAELHSGVDHRLPFITELQELIATHHLEGYTGFEYATGQPTTLDLWWVGPLPADVKHLVARSGLEVKLHAATVTEADLSSVAALLKAAAPAIEDSAIEVSLTTETVGIRWTVSRADVSRARETADSVRDVAPTGPRIQVTVQARPNLPPQIAF